MSNGKGLVTRALMLAVAVFLALPVVTNAQNGRGRRHKNDVFVNGHDARDGRRDGRGPRRDRRDRRNDNYNRRDPRDLDGDGDYDSRDEYIRRQRQQQQRNSGYGTYGNNGGYGNYGGYGNRGYGNNGYGNYSQSQQTALNAGYNEGIKEGRRDRGRGYRNP